MLKQVKILQADLFHPLHYFINGLAGLGSLLLGDVSRLRLDLLKDTLAVSASRLRRINALGVTSVVLAAVDTHPDVLVVDLVAVFRSDLDFSTIDRVVFEQGGAFVAPFLEAGTVGVVANVGDHEVGEMTVFMCQRVEEAVFGVDDPFRQLDGCMMLGRRLLFRRSSAELFSLPVGSSSSGLQSLAPNDLDSTGFLCKFLDLTVGHGVIQDLEEVFGKGSLLIVKVLFPLQNGSPLLCFRLLESRLTWALWAVLPGRRCQGAAFFDNWFSEGTEETLHGATRCLLLFGGILVVPFGDHFLAPERIAALSMRGLWNSPSRLGR